MPENTTSQPPYAGKAAAAAPPESPHESSGRRPITSPRLERSDGPEGSSQPGRPKKEFKLWKRPDLKLQTTTHWTYPSQHYGLGMQGHKNYVGATPSWVIWNLLERYTREGDTVLDPMCGSGTTLDVCQDIGRKGIGFDLAPFREDIQQADARKLPLASHTVDFAFIDPPYSTHVKYSGLAQCIGELDSRTPAYFEAMDKVIGEIYRVLRNRRYMALYVADSFKKGKPFSPIGFELFALMRKRMKPVDIICVQRGNRTLKRNHWHTSAVEGNYFLRGFNYLFLFKKEDS